MPSPEPMYCEPAGENGEPVPGAIRQSANVATRRERHPSSDTNSTSQQAPAEEKPTIKRSHSTRRKSMSGALQPPLERKSSTAKSSRPPLTARKPLQNAENTQRERDGSSKGYGLPPASPVQPNFAPAYAPPQLVTGGYPPNGLVGSYFGHNPMSPNPMSPGSVPQMSPFQMGTPYPPGYFGPMQENLQPFNQNYSSPVNTPYNAATHAQQVSPQVRSMEDRFRSRDSAAAPPALTRSLSQTRSHRRSYVEEPRETYEYDEPKHRRASYIDPDYEDEIARRLDKAYLYGEMAPPPKPRRNPSTRSANSEHKPSRMERASQGKKAVTYAEDYADEIRRAPSPPQIPQFTRSSPYSSSDIKMRERLRNADSHLDATGAEFRGGISHAEVRRAHHQPQLAAHTHRTKSTRSTHSRTNSEMPRSSHTSKTGSSRTAGYTLTIQTTGGAGPTEVFHKDTTFLVPEGSSTTITTSTEYDGSERGSSYGGQRRLEGRSAGARSSGSKSSR